MGVAPHPRRQLLLRGEAHGAFGECASATDPIGRSAGAISAGGDYVRLWKAHQAVPNEDCAFACDDGERTLLVVFGDHGFVVDNTASSSGPARQGGASPEEVLVPGFAWLLGGVH